MWPYAVAHKLQRNENLADIGLLIGRSPAISDQELIDRQNKNLSKGSLPTPGAATCSEARTLGPGKAVFLGVKQTITIVVEETEDQTDDSPK